MSAFVREWRDESRAISSSHPQQQQQQPVSTATSSMPTAAGRYQTVNAAAALPRTVTPSITTPPNKRMRKVTPQRPEDDDDDEIDETFLALQKLLHNMEGMRRSQVAPVSTHVVQPGTSTTAAREEMLESRRREREQFRHSLLSKSTRNANNNTGASTGSRRRRPASTNCIDDDDDDDDENPTPSVESTISNRMMNGSFSRYSVHSIARERWAKEETERLPIVLLPNNGVVTSPVDNPKLNVMLTDEYLLLADQLDAALQAELKDAACHLTPPRSTWCIQMRDLDALQC